MALAPGSKLGPYEVLSLLGAGGMGEVYRARDTRLERTVALKVLPEHLADDPDLRQRFEREAKLLASLNHPGIAHLYGFEAAILPDSKKVHLLAMELVEGEDLATRLARGKLSLDEAIDVARQVAEALEEAHEHGIVHRDLKPANVKRTSDGKVKLLDFGLAKAWAGKGPSGSASVDLSQSPTLPHTGTQAGVILGTAAYMSPEQARGKAVDRRSDIWAFGVVLFEMLSGRRLFQGETVSDTLAAVLGQEMPWAALPARTPTRLRQLLQRCLEPDPRQRLRDIGEARIALGNVRTLDEADSSPAAPRATARLPRLLIRWLPLFLVAATALAVSMWAIRTRSPREAGSLSVQHFDLAFPANIQPLPSLANTIALSPDGSMVATVGVKDGTRRLFVRRLDTAEITEISETVGVTGTTFSPDGTKIAYCCQSGLLWFSLSDRQRSRVALDGDLGSGLAWGEPGIVFTRDSALWIAPAAGGEPRPLTTLDVQRHEVLHIGPILLPGDRTVLFTSFTTVPGAERIEAIAVDGGSRHVVVERATTPRWSSTGHLLFEREGAVLAAPFDGQTTRVTGSAAPVLPSGLVGRTRVGLLAFQVGANGALLFMPADFDAERLVSVARDGSARTLGLPRGHYASPRISPDGRRVMVARESSAFEVLSLERGTSALLTTAIPGTSQGVWNRDGTRIAFRRHAIFWKAADGSDQQGEVKGSAATDYPTGPGPDGDSILVVRLRPETSGDVYLLSLSGAFAPRPLIESKAYEGGAQLSPDGRWLVYASNEKGAFEIHVRTFPELDRQWPVSESGGTQPRWSASGREIYYRDGRHLMAVPFDGRGREPLVGKAQALFDDEYEVGLSTTIAMYDVTPDGHFLMLRRQAGGGHLRIVLNWTEELKRILAEHAR